MKEIECRVLGKVHGVGFRDFVVKKAAGLWLSGFVENAGMGELRVVAQGAEERLDRLIEHLRKGPFLARVRDVEVEWKEPEKEYKGFVARY